MAKPSVGAMKKLKKVVRYLKGAPRYALKYAYEEKPEGLSGWADTDFAGCQVSRKSTSGGIIMQGKHVIKSWSTNQAVVALSSGEAECYGLVKAASVALGIRCIGEDLGMRFLGKICIRADASAAIGIANRVGIGKVRHIEVNQLWLQEKVYEGKMEIVKVRSEENMADALTKALDSKGIRSHVEGIGAEVRMGRHPLAPKLSAEDEALEE